MDPIADMLTRIRNSAMAGHEKMVCPSSRVKKGIVDILEREGFISGWREVDVAGNRKGLEAYLQPICRHQRARHPKVLREVWSPHRL